MSSTPKRTAYLEVVLTMAIMAFLVAVIAGGFNQRTDDAPQLTMHAE
jgi:type II secretory pathway pseudopilin PulG